MTPENMLKYKGYTATIHFDAEDGILVGRVIGIDDIIGFHATNAEDVKKEFKVTIDGYIKSCREMGEVPNKPMGGQLVLTLPVDLELSLEQASEETGRSAKAIALDAIRDVLSPSAGKAAAKRTAKTVRNVRTKTKRSPRRTLSVEK